MEFSDLYTYIRVYTNVAMYVCTYVCTHVCLHVQYVCMVMYMYTYVCMSVGAFEVCSELYDALEIKSIQIDTLG